MGKLEFGSVSSLVGKVTLRMSAPADADPQKLYPYFKRSNECRHPPAQRGNATILLHIENVALSLSTCAARRIIR